MLIDLILDRAADIATADELIDDEAIYLHYAEIGFVEEDFFCNLKSNEGDE